MKGVKIEFFTLCMAFRKVIFFIYQKIYVSDRVPLSLCFDVVELKTLLNSQNRIHRPFDFVFNRLVRGNSLTYGSACE